MSRLAAEFVRTELARDTADRHREAQATIAMYASAARWPVHTWHVRACGILTRMRALYDARVGESDAERLAIAEREWTRDHPRAAR